jgi:predicted O-methyltransferase YrrM
VAQRAGLDPRHVRRLRWLYKARTVRQNRAKITRNLPFVILDPEPDNFTYPIANEDELGPWVATVARCEPQLAARLIAEPAADVVLRERLRNATTRRWLWTKRSPAFGKRLGWYALVRALRPALIIETGVHDGLGSMLLLRALEHNRADGHPGRLISFDVNPSAGRLVGSDRLWDLRIQSSREGLPRVLEQAGEVGMFIYDGWHSYEDERRDLELAADHLAADGILVSDDAQVTRALADVCAARGLDYFEFQEIPVRHFYPGAVLGAGRRNASQ